MRVIVIGAGQVGTAVVEAIHDEHDVTVVDLDQAKLDAISYRCGHPDGARATAPRASPSCAPASASTDLVIASTDRAEVEHRCVDARARPVPRQGGRSGAERGLPRGLARGPVRRRLHGLVRAGDRAGRGARDRPSQRGSDRRLRGRSRADGRVRGRSPTRDGLSASRSADAGVPDECVVASIIRGKSRDHPRRRRPIEDGDRIVLISSPEAAQEWARRLAGRPPASRASDRGRRRRDGPHDRNTLASLELRRAARRATRRASRADRRASSPTSRSSTPTPRTSTSSRARTWAARTSSCAAPTATRPTCCRTDRAGGIGRRPQHRRRQRSRATSRSSEASGIDLALNQRLVTAEEIVRFTHDPRTLAFSMVEHDLGEVIELDVREGSR